MKEQEFNHEAEKITEAISISSERKEEVLDILNEAVHTEGRLSQSIEKIAESGLNVKELAMGLVFMKATMESNMEKMAKIHEAELRLMEMVRSTDHTPTMKIRPTGPSGEA